MVLKGVYIFGWMVLCRGNICGRDCMVCVKGIRKGGLVSGFYLLLQMTCRSCGGNGDPEM